MLQTTVEQDTQPQPQKHNNNNKSLTPQQLTTIYSLLSNSHSPTTTTTKLQLIQQTLHLQNNPKLKQLMNNTKQSMKQSKQQSRHKIEEDVSGLKVLEGLVGKEVYNYQLVEQQLHKCMEGQRIDRIWGIVQPVHEQVILLYNLHLLHTLSQYICKPQYTQQISTIIQQGWQQQNSRMHMIKYLYLSIMHNKTNKKQKHKQIMEQKQKQKQKQDKVQNMMDVSEAYEIGNGVWEMIMIVEQLIDDCVQKNKIQLGMEGLIRDWVVFGELYLAHNQQYSQFKINKCMHRHNHTKDSTYLQHKPYQLTPPQLQHLSTTPQFPISLYQTNPNTSLISLLSSLHSTQTQTQTHIPILQQYISAQLNAISNQLINNSYPSHRIVVDSYVRITNVGYVVTKWKYGQEKWGKNMRIAVVEISKAVCNMLCEMQGKQDMEKEQFIRLDSLIKLLSCKQRLKMLAYLNDNRPLYFPQSTTLLPTSILLMHLTYSLVSCQPLPLTLTTHLLQLLSSKPNNALDRLTHNQLYLNLLIYLARVQQKHNQFNKQSTQALQKLRQVVLQRCSDSGNAVGYLMKYFGVVFVVACKFRESGGSVGTVEQYVKRVFEAINRQQKMIAYAIHIIQNKPNSFTHLLYKLPTVATTATHLCLTSTTYNTHPLPLPQLPHLHPYIPILFTALTTTSPWLPILQSQIFSPCKQSQLYNLFQLQDTGIKFHQIMEHNMHGKQSIFESDVYRNHVGGYLGLEAVKILVQAGGIDVQKVGMFISQKLLQIKSSQYKLSHNSNKFYQYLKFWKYLHLLCHNPIILTHILTLQLSSTSILTQLIEILQTGYIHPLVRQYISVIIGLLYRQVRTNRDGSQQGRLLYSRWRNMMMGTIVGDNVDVNVWVPLIFGLGYQMIEYKKHSVNNKDTNGNTNGNIGQIKQYVEQTMCTFMKYISCHHAYIRSIVQYYIKQCLSLNPTPTNTTTNLSFLQNLCNNVWQNDKDCIKILKNIGIAVEGYKQAIQSEEGLDFLGYERVEEYPSASARIMGQMRNDAREVFKKIVVVNQRNIGKYQRNANKQDINTKQIIDYLIKINKAIKQRLQKYTTDPSPPPLVLHYKQPPLIIIATLLQKVHNFGYILRTLHKTPSILLVPSSLPLTHPECQQFIPQNSQTHVLQIKQSQLLDYVRVNKKLGYKMIALEQCAGSVRVEQCVFPDRYMLLLGNQRLGAPAALLNLADVLVQIEQVGKVRSFNVHVSMAICLWEATRNKHNSKQTTIENKQNK